MTHLIFLFFSFFIEKNEKKIIFLKGIEKNYWIVKWEERYIHVQMNHINTLAIDQSQGFVTYLWEGPDQSTMNNVNIRCIQMKTDQTEAK